MLYERVGKASGFAFVILVLLSAFLYPQQPKINSAPAITLAWVHHHRVALQAGMVIGFFAAAAFIWFVGYLRHVLGEAEGLSPMVFGTGLAVGITSGLSALPIALLAFMDAQPGGLTDLYIVRMLGDLNQVFFGLSSALTMVFLIALGWSMLRGLLGARWVGWVSLVIAACNGIAVWSGATFSTYHGKGWAAAGGWGAYLGFLAVVLATSIMLLRARPAAS